MSVLPFCNSITISSRSARTLAGIPPGRIVLLYIPLDPSYRSTWPFSILASIIGGLALSVSPLAGGRERANPPQESSLGGGQLAGSRPFGSAFQRPSDSNLHRVRHTERDAGRALLSPPPKRPASLSWPSQVKGSASPR